MSNDHQFEADVKRRRASFLAGGFNAIMRVPQEASPKPHTQSAPTVVTLVYEGPPGIDFEEVHERLKAAGAEPKQVTFEPGRLHLHFECVPAALLAFLSNVVKKISATAPELVMREIS